MFLLSKSVTDLDLVSFILFLFLLLISHLQPEPHCYLLTALCNQPECPSEEKKDVKISVKPHTIKQTNKLTNKQTNK